MRVDVINSNGIKVFGVRKCSNCSKCGNYFLDDSTECDNCFNSSKLHYCTNVIYSENCRYSQNLVGSLNVNGYTIDKEFFKDFINNNITLDYFMNLIKISYESKLNFAVLYENEKKSTQDKIFELLCIRNSVFNKSSNMNESLKEFFQKKNNLFYEFFYHLLNYDTVVNKLIQDFKINECYFYQKLIQTPKDIEIEYIELNDEEKATALMILACKFSTDKYPLSVAENLINNSPNIGLVENIESDLPNDENKEQINIINWTSNGIEIDYYQILIFFFMKFIQLIKLLFSFITIIP